MYKIPRQSYTTEFKQEAIRQIEAEGKNACAASADDHTAVAGEALASDLPAPLPAEELQHTGQPQPYFSNSDSSLAAPLSAAK